MRVLFACLLLLGGRRRGLPLAPGNAALTIVIIIITITVLPIHWVKLHGYLQHA
jgi:hypothetical protein